MKRQGREDYYVRKEPREITHNAMLVSYSMADVVSSLEDKKKKKTLRRNKILELLVNGVY